MTLEREAGGLDLERGAQLVELHDVLHVEMGDAGAAVGLDLHEPLGLQRSQRGPQRVPGDAEVRAQLLLDEARAGGALAAEDLASEPFGDRIDVVVTPGP